MIKTISSIQNPTIKHFTSERKSRLRKKSGEFLIEGEREIFLAHGWWIRNQTTYFLRGYF